MRNSFLRASALALVLGFAAPVIAQEQQQDADPVVAIVNGQEVKRSELVELQQSVPQLANAPLEAVYEQLLDHMINVRLITNQAREKGLADDPAVQQRVRQAEERALQEVYLTRTVDEELTEEKLKAKYDELIAQAEPREEVRARHILVESEDEAKEIIKQLEGGASFEELAKEKSTDPGAANGGDLGFFTADMMVPEFSDAAFALAPGEITKEPVKSQFGYHVIKLEERRKVEPPPFEEVKDQIRSAMAGEVIEAKVKELRDAAEVKKFDLSGKEPAPQEPAAEEPAAEEKKN